MKRMLLSACCGLLGALLFVDGYVRMMASLELATATVAGAFAFWLFLMAIGPQRSELP